MLSRVDPRDLIIDYFTWDRDSLFLEFAAFRIVVSCVSLVYGWMLAFEFSGDLIARVVIFKREVGWRSTLQEGRLFGICLVSMFMKWRGSFSLNGLRFLRTQLAGSSQNIHVFL